MLISRAVDRAMIEVEGLSVRDPRTQALRLNGVKLRVERREVLSVLSHDATAGETLIGALGGVVRGWQGRIQILGRELQAWGPELLERVGVSFDAPNQHRSLSVRENLQYWSGFYDVRTHGIEELVESFGLKTRIDTRVEELVDGELRRLSLACSLLHEPELWMFHIPYLDPTTREVLGFVVRAQKNLGTTILVSSQDAEWLASLGGRAVDLARVELQERACA